MYLLKNSNNVNMKREPGEICFSYAAHMFDNAMSVKRTV